MWWRLTAPAFEENKGESNKRAFKRLVKSGAVPGVLAFSADEPVAWCAVQPREAYPRLDRSRILKRIDDEPVWSVTCLFVAREFRQAGISVQTLKAAIELARASGARIVEGYPVEPRKGELADAFAWTGTASAFRKAGFKEVARRSETRPMMRRFL